MNWLVLGSSSHAPQSLIRAKRDFPDCRTITCNRGFKLLSNPDVYFLSDSVGCRMFSAVAQEMQTHGTHWVTLQRLPSALKERGVERCNEFVRGGHPYEPFQLSGLWCVEYAARNGATTILLVGLDGYRHQHDYFDGEGYNANDDSTEKIVKPLTQRLVAKYPEIRFICYGSPLYTVNEPNWEVR